MRFPVIIRHRKAEVRIYAKSKNYGFFRVAAYVGGKRRMASYGTYSEARGAADKLVRDIASGSQAAALTAGQANDALAALQRLDGLYRDTGRRVSLLAVAGEYAEAARKLTGHTLGEAVDGFLATMANVKRMDLGQAVEKFIEGRAPKTKAKDGKRPQLSAGYHYIVSMWLREFAKTFPNTAVSDLTKDLLNAYMSKHDDVSARTRNGRRTVVGMFLKWAVCQDYLPPTHRLIEASGMAHERQEAGEIECYRATELRALLENANADLRPVLALQGLAGLRLEEALRLSWQDVWHVAGHIEITSAKSKTRSRRLVEIVPALAAWIEPYRGRTGRVWTGGRDAFFNAFASLRESLGIPARRNGLRHAFVSCCYVLNGENATSMQAGHSPAMVHSNYKGLTTKAEAERWFAVAPATQANVLQLVAASKGNTP